MIYVYIYIYIYTFVSTENSKINLSFLYNIYISCTYLLHLQPLAMFCLRAWCPLCMQISVYKTLFCFVAYKYTTQCKKNVLCAHTIGKNGYVKLRHEPPPPFSHHGTVGCSPTIFFYFFILIFFWFFLYRLGLVVWVYCIYTNIFCILLLCRNIYII